MFWLFFFFFECFTDNLEEVVEECWLDGNEEAGQALHEFHARTTYDAACLLDL